ncbi:Malate-2H(+)/Na(+)-lactate antiporter [Paraliobacillus sp. PM-2]|uniref:Na+/H+ antiporter NhaC family protein n=1 Tax=Paraliobacillus sp. PM-2 TaxID=1462524 RepID=UPI00061C7C26|nr:Na+/H+ antiporter NhaC family protein [Paraliobacillus sp. PM-2]CQR46552.1 Malate-2H(+)/Na(+)-lactate antiporter [Paraliobacillus sp. PM-2]
MEATIYSLIPAILMLILVLLTRKILLSLGTGIIVGALLLHEFNIFASLKQIWIVFRDIFYVIDEGWNFSNLYLLGFLLLLGITTAFMTASGGSKAFGEWAIRRVKTRRGAQLIPSVLGILIFIDDYFNSLAVGQVARPVTDRFKISRAKLAYIIDSTSAPITVITPISSWGAYIIGTLGSIFAAAEITAFQPLEAFVRMVPLNFYAFAAIISVFIVALFNFNFGLMRKHEETAISTGELYDKTKGNIAGDLQSELTPHKNGKMRHLLLPIGTLVLITVIVMLITGYLATEGQVTIFTLFANTDVNLSLFIGGLAAVLISLCLSLMQGSSSSTTLLIFKEGIKSMLPAIYILILAWMIGSIIDLIGTGAYLAEVVERLSFNTDYLALLLFLVAGFMALSTGTSWGTFGIMLPIAAQIAFAYDIDLVLPAMAAVLAGSVFGDHCSPISDTSILSSTGAGSNHIDHVLTQIPYALLSALAAGIGYVIYGFTHQTFVALLATIITMVVLLFTLGSIVKKKRT